MADDKHSSAERGDGVEHSEDSGAPATRLHQHRPSAASSHTAAHEHDDSPQRPAKKRQDST